MWELIFLMFILKIPIVYLCYVVWWAIKAEPKPPEAVASPAELPEPCLWPGSRAPRRVRPAGGGGRRRRARATVAR